MDALSLAACEPVPVIFAGLAGPGASMAYVWGGVGVLVAVVAAKSFVFAAVARIGWRCGILSMVLANIVSTIPGVLVGGAMSSGLNLVLGLGFLALFAWFGGSWLCRSLSGTSWQWLTPGRFLVGSLVLAFVSSLLGAFVTLGPLAEKSTILFLAAKAASLFLLFLVSLPLTIAWEGLVVATLNADYSDQDRLLQSVVKANLLTFFGIFLAGAAVAIPIRMRRRNFLWPYGE